MRISLDEHGSKIRKVSRCRPIASNETILTTKQEFFFTKVAPVQSMTDIKHVLLGFWLMMHSGMFISSYTTVYFFVNNFFFRMFIFQWIRYSKVLDCFLVEKLVRTQLGEWRTGVIQNVYRCAQWAHGVLFYLLKFNVSFIKKGCVSHKWLLFSNEINFCSHGISLFLL